LAAKEVFLVSAKAPETGAIQGAFSASSFWYARCEAFAIVAVSFSLAPVKGAREKECLTIFLLLFFFFPWVKTHG
jgi:hypothetical protein